MPALRHRTAAAAVGAGPGPSRRVRQPHRPTVVATAGLGGGARAVAGGPVRPVRPARRCRRRADPRSRPPRAPRRHPDRRPRAPHGSTGRAGAVEPRPAPAALRARRARRRRGGAFGVRRVRGVGRSCRTRRTTPQRWPTSWHTGLGAPAACCRRTADLAAGTASVLERQYLRTVERAHRLPRAQRHRSTDGPRCGCPGARSSAGHAPPRPGWPCCSSAVAGQANHTRVPPVARSLRPRRSAERQVRVCGGVARTRYEQPTAQRHQTGSGDAQSSTAT